MFLYVFLLSVVHLGVGASILQRSEADLTRRAYQSEAVCQDQYGWMDNSKSQSPCQVLAYVLGACIGPSFTVSALPNTSTRYTPPGPPPLASTSCSCSWSSYNLFQACTVCQGNVDGSVWTWAGWIPQCTNLVPPEAFPKDVTLSNLTSIPAWATTDPDTWNNAIFDVVAAQNIANEHQPDFTPPPVTPASTNNTKRPFPVGAVVGGVVGGAMMILIAVAAVIFYKRKRVPKEEGTKPIPHDKSDIGTLQDHSKPMTLFQNPPAGSSAVFLHTGLNAGGPMTSSSGVSSFGLPTPGPMVHALEPEGYFPAMRETSSQSFGLQSTPPSAFNRHSMMTHSHSFSQDSIHSAVYTQLGSMAEGGPENRIDPYYGHRDMSRSPDQTPDTSSLHLPTRPSEKRQLLQTTANLTPIPSRSPTPALSQAPSTQQQQQPRWNPPSYDEVTAESASQSSHYHSSSIGSISTISPSPDNRRVSNSLQGMVSAIREESEPRESARVQPRADTKR